MVSRYSRQKMRDLWSVDSKYRTWLEVEKAIVQAWNMLGLITDDECGKILMNAKYDASEIDLIESETQHDLISFVASVSNSLGEEGRWLHYGVTSSDCIDTALSLQMRDSVLLIIEEIDNFLAILRRRAHEFKHTLMVGRSHGIHGEPITFGLVIALWYSEIERHRHAFDSILECVSVGQVSGAMGTMAHSPFELEENVCRILGLNPVKISNQVIQRDRIARLVSGLALLASSCEKISVAIRHLQRTEVYECEEYFGANQKGSSAMPHKRNPILSENVTGLCRIIRSYCIPAMENVALWHERDISHSSVERFMLPDVFITSDFMLSRLSAVVDNLSVYPENMLRNLSLTGGLVFSQRVLLELIKRGVSRELAYRVIQRNAMRVWDDIRSGEGTSTKSDTFLRYLLCDRCVLDIMDEQSIRELFEYDYYLKNVDNIFRRVFA